MIKVNESLTKKMYWKITFPQLLWTPITNLRRKFTVGLKKAIILNLSLSKKMNINKLIHEVTSLKGTQQTSDGQILVIGLAKRRWKMKMEKKRKSKG